MITETLCLEILRLLHNHDTTCTRTFNRDAPDEPLVTKSTEQHSRTDAGLVRPLLSRYDLADVDAAIRWLKLGEYVSRTQWGMGGPWVHTLQPRGVEVADAGRFPDEDLAMFYREDPHEVFLAHQFHRPGEDGLVEQLRGALAGYTVTDGRVEALEQFRHAILQKIKRARFFCCLLTRRAKLEGGDWVSSVWLYQEIGAAIAMGKEPLLLVENDMDSHYAGELQRTYEFIPFDRPTFADILDETRRRFDTDLERNKIPLPGTRP
jgi:hypothetical protein